MLRASHGTPPCDGAAEATISCCIGRERGVCSDEASGAWPVGRRYVPGQDTPDASGARDAPCDESRCLGFGTARVRTRRKVRASRHLLVPRGTNAVIGLPPSTSPASSPAPVKAARLGVRLAPRGVKPAVATRSVRPCGRHRLRGAPRGASAARLRPRAPRGRRHLGGRDLRRRRLRQRRYPSHSVPVGHSEEGDRTLAGSKPLRSHAKQ